MSLDKIKAMRNAERFLAQGKIRAAINEYKSVVENDPKDFATLNMLGDLYAKASDTQEAVKCFTQVAEHYGKQGFSQKAIAIYNKISRISPESLEILAKLAQLYQSKGSVAEARSHYTALAEQYQRKGNKAEALMVWRQIAQVDPRNTDIYLKIAAACLEENQKEEAATAFIEAGLRFNAKKQYDTAVKAFLTGLEIRPNDLIGLKGIINAQIILGNTDEATKILETVLAREPYNREVILLLVDCYLETNNPRDAERVVIQLIEKEPANYPKFLEVVESYLKNDDLASATRILSMTSEHLLAGGQAEELEKWVNEILARDSNQIEALGLLVRFHGWQRDEDELVNSLKKLAEAARLNNLVEDERYALTQLVSMLPYEINFAERLRELVELHGFAEVPLDYQSFGTESSDEISNLENLAAVSDNGHELNSPPQALISDFAEFLTEPGIERNGTVESNKDNFSSEELTNPPAFEDYADFAVFPPLETNGGGGEGKSPELSPFERTRLQQELESVEFYIEQGYQDLAIKSLDLLETELGKQPEIDQVRQLLGAPDTQSANREESKKAETASVIKGSAKKDAKGFDNLAEFRNELDLEEPETDDDNKGDYETHYHLGIAYMEMGLLEDSIREFQDAFKLVTSNDGTRRFLQCCNLLGHCFMEKGMPNLALMWYKRCLETANLTSEERQGLRYEVANAYEAGGEHQKAIEYFEEIYAENVDYRDTGKRLKNLGAE